MKYKGNTYSFVTIDVNHFFKAKKKKSWKLFQEHQFFEPLSISLKLFVDVVANQPETQKASMEMRKAKQLGT